VVTFIFMSVHAMGAPASVSAGAADLQQVIHGPLIIGVAAVVRGHQGAVWVDEEVGGQAKVCGA